MSNTICCSTSTAWRKTSARVTAAELKLPVKLYDPDKHYRAVRGKWIGFDPDR